MRKIIWSRQAQKRVNALADYLLDELKLSESAAFAYLDRMSKNISLLSVPVDYPVCRFKKWQIAGWHCLVFEKHWIIAYQVYDEGVVIRDIRHTKTINEVE